MKNSKSKKTLSAMLAESMLIFKDKIEAIKKLMPINVQRHIGDGRNGLKSNTECLLLAEPVKDPVHK